MTGKEYAQPLKIPSPWGSHQCYSYFTGQSKSTMHNFKSLRKYKPVPNLVMEKKNPENLVNSPNSNHGQWMEWLRASCYASLCSARPRTLQVGALRAYILTMPQTKYRAWAENPEKDGAMKTCVSPEERTRCTCLSLQ